MVYSVNVTVTLQLAVLPPSSLFTVITASPALCAVTVPFLSTLAIAGLSELHVTVLFVASAGLTVAFSCSLFPSSSVRALLFSVTPVTATAAGGSAFAVTVTLQFLVQQALP